MLCESSQHANCCRLKAASACPAAAWVLLPMSCCRVTLQCCLPCLWWSESVWEAEGKQQLTLLANKAPTPLGWLKAVCSGHSILCSPVLRVGCRCVCCLLWHLAGAEDSEHNQGKGLLALTSLQTASHTVVENKGHLGGKPGLQHCCHRLAQAKGQQLPQAVMHLVLAPAL